MRLRCPRIQGHRVVAEDVSDYTAISQMIALMHSQVFYRRGRGVQWTGIQEMLSYLEWKKRDSAVALFLTGVHTW